MGGGTISVIMSVGPSVRMEQLGSLWTAFHEIWYLSIFRKSVEKIQVPLKSDQKKKQVLYMKIYIHFWPYLAQFFLECEMFQKNL